MAIASGPRVRCYLNGSVIALSLALLAPALSFAAADTAKAEENRKKPLQRCGELKDDAQLQCLQKARERVVEARKKREAAEDGKGKSASRAP